MSGRSESKNSRKLQAAVRSLDSCGRYGSVCRTNLTVINQSALRTQVVRLPETCVNPGALTTQVVHLSITCVEAVSEMTQVARLPETYVSWA